MASPRNHGASAYNRAPPIRRKVNRLTYDIAFAMGPNAFRARMPIES